MNAFGYIRRVLKAPEKSFFLFGPRGSGKTSWIREECPNALRIDLLDEAVYQRYLVDPGAFARELAACRPVGRVAIDEVQRLPSLLNEVHRLIEEQNMVFILSGSSSRKIKEKGVNLLAGRALHRSLHPFLPEELGDRYSLDETLRFGSLPIVAAAVGEEERRETLEAYVRLYLQAEIKAEALVRNLPGFARFFPVAAVCHGQTVNTASLARDAGVARTTVAGYLDILEDTLMCFRVEGFEPRLRVKERKHPKLYWTDSGIVRAVRGNLYPPSDEERGALFEGLVAQTLRAYGQYRNLYDSMRYWALSGSATEVDFLLQKADGFVAIEVKSGRRFQERWCRGLRAVRSLQGLRRRIIVCPAGEIMKTEDGIEVWPFLRFCQVLAENGLWE